MKSRNCGYKRLAALLAARGIPLTPKSLNTKINRNAFSAQFLVECLRALEVGALLIPPAVPEKKRR